MVCYRFAAYATPLRTVPAWQPARFSRGDEDEPTQYLALHPLGPLAELMRNAELRSPEQVARSAPARGRWRFRSTTSRRSRSRPPSVFGITAEQLVGDDYGPCQAARGALRTKMEGAIVPSAALPGTRNVVLFGPRVAAPYLTQPVSTLDVPASITADGARPPTSLMLARPLPRATRTPRSAAWRNGIDFRFAEPNWVL